ncbi:hypothetical protein ACTMSW_04475 [Micromonospora sp. BQ11]|uniref:hypothetical protein n=1 Tax=Micromonospora sp. BQ11 TaxID=3452212 RepID=UPI003F8C94E1
MKLRKIALSIALTAGTTASVLATAGSPASAGTCSTPRCGGVVENDAASGPGVYIANCWSGTASTYAGDNLPCTNNRVSSTTYPAAWFLTPGQSSSSYPKYYDTDAYKVGANCVMTTSGTTIDRRGRGSVWYKITNVNRIYVQSYRCF